MIQTETELEQKLIERLTRLGYEPVTLRRVWKSYQIDYQYQDAVASFCASPVEIG